MSSNHRNYLLDLGTLLREQAIVAHQRAAQSSDGFDLGVAYGYYKVLSLLENQAAAFGLSMEDVGLKGFDVDAELLASRHKGDSK